MLRRLAACTLLMALSGCDQIIHICRSCIEADSQLEVPKAELSKIELLKANVSLPSSAQRVFYHEECGQDCAHWLTFSLPETDAKAFAAAMTGGAELTLGDPFTDAVGGDAAPDMRWWPAKLPAAAKGAAFRRPGGGGAIAVEAKGGRAAVWLFEYEL